MKATLLVYLLRSVMMKIIRSIGWWLQIIKKRAALNMIMKNLAIERFPVMDPLASFYLFIRAGDYKIFFKKRAFCKKEPLCNYTQLKTPANNILNVIFSRDYNGPIRFLSWDNTKLNGKI